MAGRPRSEQGSEKREHRTVVRWTKSQKERLDKAREKMGLPFDVDVVRFFTLQGIDELLGEEVKNVAE